MFLVQKVKWRPTVSHELLKERGHLLVAIRQFFNVRGILEVDTPLLCPHTVTAPHIDSFQILSEKDRAPLYLQTSPEYAMKRLLAAGSGPIYQISKAFRQGEQGPLHNPEFTLIEWYRPNFTDSQLMQEVDELLQLCLGTSPAQRVAYDTLFLEHCHLHPTQASLTELQKLARQVGFSDAHFIDRDTLVQGLFSYCIEPHLGVGAPTFVYHFPAGQAALAQLHPQDPSLSLRFEVYVDGIELANGFQELRCAKEQTERFQNDNIKRKQFKLPEIPIDPFFLQALESGLPFCSGIAMGFDRLLLLKTKAKALKEVIAFPWTTF